jgi:energy-coupling factor transporter transmembrane protein EcfT
VSLPTAAVVLLIAVSALVGVNTVLTWWRRRKLRVRIRGEWGTPRLKTRDVSAIASYHHALTSTSSDNSLDQRTWTDLDLDAVFAVLDRTESSIGEQRLYHRLRSTSSVTTLSAFEALVSRLSQDRKLREHCQVELAALANASGYQVWSLTQPGAIEVRPWHRLFPVLTTAVAGLIVLVFVWPQLLAPLIGVGVLGLAIRLANARRVWRVVETFRFIGPLIAAAAMLRRVHDQSHESLTKALNSDLPQLTRLRVLSGWLARDSVPLDPLTAIVVETLNSLFLLDANALFFGAGELRRRGPALLRTLAAVGEIDGAIAVASFRAGVSAWTRPILRPPGSVVTIEDLGHPLLLEGVRNSIDLAPPHGVLITGSNMSGKSTFLRSVGLAAVLGQTVNTCVAGRYEAPQLIVRSCIGRGDDLLLGKSYYLDEVQAVIEVIRASQSGQAHLFLFDELFRGTNAIERVAAAEATLRQLATTAHVVIAATHDIEVVVLLEGIYASFHFVDRMEADGLVFEYRLATGPSTTRNAIALLELNGAPAALVRHARERAAHLSAAPSRLLSGQP